MKKIIKAWEILRSRHFAKELKRLWRRNINPPKEKFVYLKPDNLETISLKISESKTPREPKQVAFDQETQIAYVSCMSGNSLSLYSTTDKNTKKIKEIKFPNQCVEITIGKKYIYVTTSDFKRPPSILDNKIWILSKSGEKITSIDTGGEWSKVIAIDEKREIAAVSNWHSHNISFIKINPKKAKLIQLVSWGESPRGLVFLPNGDLLVTSFYSARIGILSAKSGIWKVTYNSQPFDKAKYQGNMRHIILSPDKKYALISNLGRNLIHWWSIKDRVFETNLLVGREPNTIDIVNENLLAVSCRKSDLIYYVDLKLRKVIGKSERTGHLPTGLCKVDKDKILVTSFQDNQLELHQIIRTIQN